MKIGCNSSTIRNNSDDKEKMQSDIWAIYLHMICSDKSLLARQHSKCPKGKESWCSYDADIANVPKGKNPGVFTMHILQMSERERILV